MCRREARNRPRALKGAAKRRPGIRLGTRKARQRRAMPRTQPPPLRRAAARRPPRGPERPPSRGRGGMPAGTAPVGRDAAVRAPPRSRPARRHPRRAPNSRLRRRIRSTGSGAAAPFAALWAASEGSGRSQATSHWRRDRPASQRRLGGGLRAGMGRLGRCSRRSRVRCAPRRHGLSDASGPPAGQGCRRPLSASGAWPGVPAWPRGRRRGSCIGAGGRARPRRRPRRRRFR